MTDRLRAAVVLTIATLTLSACSRSGTTPEVSPPAGSLPHFPLHSDPQRSDPLRSEPVPGVPEPTVEVPPPPPVRWADDAEQLVVVTSGSSSCPTGPTDLAVVGDQEIRMEIGPLFPEREPCTADMAVRSTEVEVPDGVSADRPLSVLLEYEGGSERVVLDPPDG